MNGDLPCELCKARGFSCGEKLLGPKARLKVQFLGIPISRIGSSRIQEYSTIKIPSPPILESVTTGIPRPPQSNRNRLTQFFIKFHRDAITHTNYFMFYDSQQLCEKHLFAMAEQFDALRFAMTAFSALIYSVKNRYRRKRTSTSLLCDSLVRITIVSTRISK